jgi:Putative zinc-finger
MMEKLLTDDSTPFEPQSACPDAELLAVFAEGRASPAERRQLERHVATCDACHEAWIETARLRWADEGAKRTASIAVWRWAAAASFLIAGLAGSALWWHAPSPPATVETPVATLGPNSELITTAPWTRIARTRLGFAAPSGERAAAWLAMHAAVLEYGSRDLHSGTRDATRRDVSSSLRRIGLAVSDEELTSAGLRQRAGDSATFFELCLQIEAWRLDAAAGFHDHDARHLAAVQAAAAHLSLEPPIRRAIDELACAGVEPGVCSGLVLERLVKLEELLLA